jgi:hypothetical protein
MQDAIVNCLWLVRPVAFRNALIVSASAPSAAALALTAAFSSVQTLEVGINWSVSQDELIRRYCQTSSLLMNFVVVEDLTAIGSDQSVQGRLFSSLRTVLVPEAGILATIEARPGQLPLRNGAGSLAAALQDAGFYDVQSYYVSPSLDRPSELVPTDPASVRAWESTASKPTAKKLVRRLLIAASAHHLLFRHRICLAAV